MKVIFFYGINLIVTLILATLFGGVLGSIKGNELLLGAIVTLGVQLSPFITSIIYNKKYNNNKAYNYNINKYLVLSIIIPILIVVLSSIILSIFSINYEVSGYSGIILVFVIITSILGSIFEEIGWRGTLLEIFNEKYTPLISSIFVGLLWGIWHFFKISSVGIISYLLFVISVLMYGIIIAYIYNKSNKSLLNPIIFHSLINISSVLLIYNRECNLFYVSSFVISILIIFIIYLFDKKYFR